MRIACPPLVFGCPFLNFSASKTELELITRRIIQDLEGDMNKGYVSVGNGISHIHEIKKVKKIIDELTFDFI